MPEARVRRLDHVGLVGDDLDALRAAWIRLGFAPTEPEPLLGRDARTGATVSLAQRSCHVVLDGGYVELTAVDPGASNHLDPWRVRGPGLHILAFGTNDAAAERERQAMAGLQPRPVRRASRAIGYGTRGEAQFDWFMLEPANSPELLVCTVQHRTPTLVFQPDVQAHPNGAMALESLTLVFDDPAAAAARYATLFGATVEPEGEAFVLRDGEERLVLVAPTERLRRFPRAPGPVPGAAAMGLRVRDLPAALALLDAQGVGYTRTAQHHAWLAPEAAGGIVLELRQGGVP